MAKWQKKLHLIGTEVRLGAHILPAGQHTLEGDYWAQFSDMLDRVPDSPQAAAKAASPQAPQSAAPPLPPPPVPPQVEPSAAPEAPAVEASGDDASEGDDKPKRKGKGK